MKRINLNSVGFWRSVSVVLLIVICVVVSDSLLSKEATEYRNNVIFNRQAVVDGYIKSNTQFFTGAKEEDRAQYNYIVDDYNVKLRVVDLEVYNAGRIDLLLNKKKYNEKYNDIMVKMADKLGTIVMEDNSGKGE